MNIKSLLIKTYWLAYPTSLNGETSVLYLVVLGILFLLGIVARVASVRAEGRGYMKRVIGRFGNLFLTGAITGGLLLFFRYEYLPILSYRIWFGIWFLWLLVWAAFILQYWFRRKKEFAKKIAEHGSRERIEAYLPKRKK